MDEKIAVHGIVLKHQPVGEYDWLVTLLTAERGKLNAFARGARRPATKLSGNVEPFGFGTFTLFPGRNSYGLNDAKIDYYFEEFRTDLEKAAYGTFFLELADYFSRENLEAKDYLNLLYVSLKALAAGIDGLSPRLVSCVYELRAYVTEGVFPGADAYPDVSPAVKHALNHISVTPLSRLFTFSLKQEALDELDRLVLSIRNRVVDRKLHSLKMIDSL